MAGGPSCQSKMQWNYPSIAKPCTSEAQRSVGSKAAQANKKRIKLPEIWSFYWVFEGQMDHIAASHHPFVGYSADIWPLRCSLRLLPWLLWRGLHERGEVCKRATQVLTAAARNSRVRAKP